MIGVSLWVSTVVFCDVVVVVSGLVSPIAALQFWESYCPAYRHTSWYIVHVMLL